MAKDSFKDFIAVLKSFSGLMASMGVILPAFTYFTSLAPPLLALTPVISSAIALATLIVVFQRTTHSAKAQQKPGRLGRKAELVLVTAIIMVVFYATLLNVCTITAPPVEGRETLRFQIGFGKWEGGLTNEGKAVKGDSPNATIEEWMLADSLFRQGGPQILWKAWTINTAGALLAAAFILTFCLWAAGWSLLAARHTLSAGNKREPAKNIKKKAEPKPASSG